MIRRVAELFFIGFWGAVVLVIGVGSVNASPIACDVNNASVNNVIANLCVGDTDPNGKQGEIDFLDANFGAPPGFNFIGKVQHENGVFTPQEVTAGWIINSYAPGYSTYSFGFTVNAPTLLEGTDIDFGLGVKQGQGGFIAYYFSNRQFDITGAFNSLNVNGGNDFSHISMFYRDSSGFCVDCQELPEPGALSLLGLGLLGLGLNRRRIRVAK